MTAVPRIQGYRSNPCRRRGLDLLQTRAGALCAGHPPSYAWVGRRCSLNEESSEPVNAVERLETRPRAGIPPFDYGSAMRQAASPGLLCRGD